MEDRQLQSPLRRLRSRPAGPCLEKKTTCTEPWDAPGLKFAVVVEAKHLAGGEHLQALLGEGLAAISEIVHGADGAISKAQLQGEGIRAGLAIRSTEQLQIFDGAASQVAQEIDEVASLTEQATAAEGGVLGPVVGGDSTGVAGVDEGFGATEALELLLEINQQAAQNGG